MNEPSSEVRKQILEAIASGRKIEAIKIHRSATQLGLKESKDFIDALEIELRKEHPEMFKSSANSGCGTATVLFFMASSWFYFWFQS